MFGFIKQVAEPLAPHTEKASTEEGLPPLVLEAIVIAILTGLLALGFAIRLWVYLPHG